VSDERGERLAPFTTRRDLGRGHRAGADNGSCGLEPTHMMETTAAAKDVDLSICILTRSQPQLLPDCVVACLKEARRAEVTFEIIIVDNASEDRYPEKLLALSPSIRVLRNERNVGFSAGNNQAIRASRGRYVLILNDDAILQEDSLRLMLQELKSDPKIGAVGPKLLNPDGSLQIGFTNKRFPRIRGLVCEFVPSNHRLYRCSWTRRLLTEWNDGEQSGETDYVAGACLMSARAILNDAGLFDEEFYFWFDDTDLCYRIKERGYQIFYLAEARVTHYGSASLRRLTRSERHVILLRSLKHYFKKHHSGMKCFAVKLSLALVYLVRIPAVFLARLIRRRPAFQEAKTSMEVSLDALRVLLWE
jgi:GT2 family glycosyltransferase